MIDLKVLAHNQAQRSLFDQMRQNERWLLGEILGHDPLTTKTGRLALEACCAKVILENGFGEWMAKEVQK